MSISFPSWVYHRSEEARIVNGPEELAALGPGWFDTPAAFSVAAEEVAIATPADPPKRGRGRPRKNPIGENLGFQMEEEVEGEPDPE